MVSASSASLDPLPLQRDPPATHHHHPLRGGSITCLAVQSSIVPPVNDAEEVVQSVSSQEAGSFSFVDTKASWGITVMQVFVKVQG